MVKYAFGRLARVVLLVFLLISFFLLPFFFLSVAAESRISMPAKKAKSLPRAGLHPLSRRPLTVKTPGLLRMRGQGRVGAAEKQRRRPPRAQRAMAKVLTGTEAEDENGRG